MTNDLGLERRLSVLLLDTKRHNPNRYIFKSILAALQDDPLVTSVQAIDYENAVATAKSRPYDLLIAVDGQELNHDIVSRACRYVGFSVLWVWEDPYELTTNISGSQLFDLTFTNDLGSVHLYPGPAEHLPLAASAAMPPRPADDAYDYDISFIGSAWPERVTFLRRLMRAAPDLRLNLRMGANPALPGAHLDLPPSDYSGAVSHPDFLDIANRSRVNLTLNRAFSGSGDHKRAQTPGPRLFEIASVGGFQLVDSTGLKVDQLFKPGEAPEFFDGVEDCVARIRSALGDPSTRIAKAAALQATTVGRHTYKHRVARMLGSVRQAMARRPAPAVVRTPPTQPRARLLFVTHNTVGQGGFGGVEVYQEALVQALRNRYEIFFFHPIASESGSEFSRFALTDSDHAVLKTFRTSRMSPWNVLYSPELEDVFSEVMLKSRIELIHFHHTIGFCASLPLACQALGIPAVFTIQDLMPVCVKFNLTDHRGNFCGIDKRHLKTCDICLSVQDSVLPASQRYRREFISQVLQSVDRVLVNSESCLEVVSAIYPELGREKVAKLPLPAPPVQFRVASARQPSRRSSLRVVFLGNFTRVKGADTFLELAEALRDEDIDLHVCGRIDPPYDDRIAQRQLTKVTAEGVFSPGQLDLSRFDVSLHLSIWPETYCITLSEAWRAGIVPIVSDIGALGERVSHGRNGFKVPVGGAAEVAALLRSMAQDRTMLESVASGIGSHLWLDLAQHCALLEPIYEKLIDAGVSSRQHIALPNRPNSPKRLEHLAEVYGSADWTQAHTPRPIASEAPLASRVPYHIVQQMREVMAAQNLELAPRMSARLEPAKETPTGELRFTGWISAPSDPAGKLVALMRSLDGELLPATLTLTGQSPAGEPTSPALAVSVDLAPGDLLEPGAYGIEVAWLDVEARLHIVGTGAACVVAGGRARSVDPISARVGFWGDPWRALAPLPGRTISGVADLVSVTDHDPGLGCGMLALQVAGWMVAAGDTSPSLTPMLRLWEARNDLFLHAPLIAVARPDVLEELEIDRPLMSGFAGGVWLKGLPKGDYRVDLGRPSAGGVACLRLGRLKVTSGGGTAVFTKSPGLVTRAAHRLRRLGDALVSRS